MRPNVGALRQPRGFGVEAAPVSFESVCADDSASHCKELWIEEDEKERDLTPKESTNRLRGMRERDRLHGY
jgi:hypothetical protein